MTFARYFGLVAVVIFFLAGASPAQVATGTPSFGTFGGGPDVINLANLNVHLDVPVVNKPGRGTAFTYDLIYDNSVWYPVSSGSTNIWQPVLNWGWRGQTEVVTGYVSYASTPGKCRGDGGWDYYNVYSNWVYHDPFGISTFFPDLQILGGGDKWQCSGLSSRGSATADGYTLNAHGGGATVVSAGGTVFTPPVNNTSGAASFTDRNGNKITVNGSGVFTDTLGTSVLSVSGQGTPASPVSFTYTVQSGAPVYHQVNYTNYTIATNFGASGISEYKSNAAVPLVSSIVLPDGSQYSFHYESTPSTPAVGACTPYAGTTCVTGRISSVTFPTGGTIYYSYTGGNNGIATDGSAAGMTRQTPDGTWAYSRAIGSGSASVTTIIDPQNDQTLISFIGIMETSRAINQGPSTLLQTVTTCYNLCNGGQIVPVAQRTVVSAYPDGTQSKHITMYNTSGLVTEQDDYPYGNRAAGPLLRKTIITYANLGNNISDSPQSIIVQDGSSNTVSKTVYGYDETSVVPTSGTVQHAAVTGARGNLTSVTAYVSATSSVQKTFTYLDTGNVHNATDQAGNTTQYGYNDNFYTDNGNNPPQAFTPSSPTNAYVNTVTTPITGVMATYGYYIYTGQLAISTDQNGGTSYVHFDSMGRITTTNLPALPNGNRGWTLTQYPNSTEVDTFTSITSPTPTANCASCRHTQAFVDGLGRKTQTILASDPDGATIVGQSYDSLGRIQSTTTPYRSTSDPTYGLETPTYDGLNRVTKQTHGDMQFAQTYYGTQVGSGGGISSQLCSTTTYGMGYPVLTIDEAGKKRQAWFNSIGYQIEVDEPDNTGSLSLPTCYSYDLGGRLTGVSQGSQTRTYIYDWLGRMTTSTTPELGTITFSYTTGTGTLCAGDPSLLCSRVDARGVKTVYTYDALNRKTAQTYSNDPTGTATVSYFYDQTSYNGLTITNGKGHRTGMNDGSGTTAWSYDPVGNVLVEQKTIAGITKSIRYAYNLDGSLASITYPNGRVVNYQVGNAGRMLSATDLNGTLYASVASYAPMGRISSMTYGKVSGGFAGIAETFGFNNRQQHISTQAASSSGTVVNLALNYNLPGGNNGIIASFQDNVNSGLGESFAYDSLNRILSASTASNTAPGCWGQAFGQQGNPPGPPEDRYSNLTQVNVTQCTAVGLSATADVTTNHLNASGYHYDAAGNMTGDTAYSYTYDAENRIVQASGMSGGPYCYIYDGNGLRVAKKANAATCSVGTIVGIYWRSIDLDALAESDSAGNTQSEYVFFSGRRIARLDASGSVFYYYGDHLGSSGALTTANGTVCYRATFTPYGEEHATMTTCAQNYKFAGYERDTETGLDYALSRYYNFRLGRFMSADTVSGSPQDPQTQNRYAYVANRTGTSVDPCGLCPLVVAGYDDNPEKTPGIVDYAKSINAVLVFPFGGDTSTENNASDTFTMMGADLGLPTAGEQLTEMGLRAAVAGGGPVEVVTFSGGAQMFSSALSAVGADNVNLTSATYIEPGTGLTTGLLNGLPKASAQTSIIRGGGFINGILNTITRSHGIDSYRFGDNNSKPCGHSSECAFGELMDNTAPVMPQISGNSGCHFQELTLDDIKGQYGYWDDPGVAAIMAMEDMLGANLQALEEQRYLYDNNLNNGPAPYGQNDMCVYFFICDAPRLN